MPQAVPAIIIAAGQAVAGVAVVKIVTAFVINVALTYLSQALADKPRSSGPPPVNVTVNDTVDYRHIVLGTRRVGGSFIDIRTSSGGPTSPNKYLWYVIAYADHQCNNLKDAYFDEFLVPEADIDAGTGAVSTTWANGKVWIWDHLGTQAQTADAQLTSTFGAGGGGGTPWLSTDRLRGVCYRVIKMERDDTAFPTGAPDHVSAIVEGALTYDWRLDSTNGGAGSHRMDNPSTWSFSDNWARNVLWLVTGGSVVNDQSTRLVKYGIKEDYARIDWPFWTAAANISDQALSGANTPPSGGQVRYTINAEFVCGQTRDEILSLALAAGSGELVHVHGKWRLHAGAYDAPIHSFTQDDLRGDMDVEDTTDDNERINRVAAVYVDSTQQWKEQTTPYRFNAAYDTQDKGREFQKEIDLHAVTNGDRAQRICELELRKARQMRRVVFRFGRKGMKIAPHETFYFSHSRLGWINREFRCTKRKRERTEDGGIITVIAARTEDASIYTDPLTADYSSGTSITNSIQSEAPEPPTALTASSRTFAIEFNWTLGAFWTLNGITELWENTTDSFGSATKIWEGRGTRIVIGKNDTTTRFYWVRMRTIAGQTSATFPTTNGVQASASHPFGGWQLDAAGKPAGIRAVEGIADRSQVLFGGAGIQILSTPNTSVGYGYPAIAIDASATYQLTVRHKSSASSTDGLILRFNELNAALPAGKTHIGHDDTSGLETVTTERTSFVDVAANAPMPGTTMVQNTYTYTPTAGTKFASLSLYNFDPNTASVVYEVEWVTLTRTGSNVNLLSNGSPQSSTDDLIPTAATEIYDQNTAGPTAFNHGNNTVDVSTFNFNSTADGDLVCTATFDANSTANGTSLRSQTGLDVYSDTVLQIPSTASAASIIGTTDLSYVCRTICPITAGHSIDVKLRNKHTGFAVSGTTTFTEMNIQIEFVKR